VSARRRQGREDAFADNNGSSYAPEATDAAIFGSIEAVDAGRQVAKPVSIFEIYPDPVQPRRAVPSIVREKWDGTPETVADMLAYWYELASLERRGTEFEFDIRPYLEAQEEVRRPKLVKPMESAFLDLVELAASIRLNGLTNPITVARGPHGYRLETGERRWLAFHLLYQYSGDPKQWEKIPARIVDTPNVWRQASENGARSNLTAIGKARQLALLIMEIYIQKGVEFQTFDQVIQNGENDRVFYAQVADGTQFPVTGHGETILNALGFKQPSQMREHRDLLRLPDEVWQLADDLNWPYGRIADLRRKSLRDDKRFIQLAIKKAWNQGYEHIIPNDDAPTLSEAKREEPVNLLVVAEYRRIFTSLWALARQVGEGDVRTNRADLENIRSLKKWLDDLEKVVRDNLVK
jgi:ParB-like nuclease family protein